MKNLIVCPRNEEHREQTPERGVRAVENRVLFLQFLQTKTHTASPQGFATAESKRRVWLAKRPAITQIGRKPKPTLNGGSAACERAGVNRRRRHEKRFLGPCEARKRKTARGGK